MIPKTLKMQGKTFPRTQADFRYQFFYLNFYPIEFLRYMYIDKSFLFAVKIDLKQLLNKALCAINNLISVLY